MSDEKKYMKMVGEQYNREIANQERDYISQKMSPEARRVFRRPALTCQACGRPMEVSPEDGRTHPITSWERKWSVHKFCAEKMLHQLDRQSGINTDRR